MCLSNRIQLNRSPYSSLSICKAVSKALDKSKCRHVYYGSSLQSIWLHGPWAASPCWLILAWIIIKSLYIKLSQESIAKIKITGTFIDWTGTNRVVLWGSELGPLIFNISDMSDLFFLPVTVLWLIMQTVTTCMCNGKDNVYEFQSHSLPGKM